MLKRSFLLLALAASPALAADKTPPPAAKTHTIAMSDQDLAAIALGMNNVARLCASTDDGAQLCQVAAAWNDIRKRWGATLAAEPQPATAKGEKTP